MQQKLLVKCPSFTNAMILLFSKLFQMIKRTILKGILKTKIYSLNSIYSEDTYTVKIDWLI